MFNIVARVKATKEFVNLVGFGERNDQWLDDEGNVWQFDEVELLHRAKELKVPVYYKHPSEAFEAALNDAKHKGYTIRNDEFLKDVPGKNETHRVSCFLYKNGKQQSKMLHIQIYNMGNGTYELNHYVN